MLAFLGAVLGAGSLAVGQEGGGGGGGLVNPMLDVTYFGPSKGQIASQTTLIMISESKEIKTKDATGMAQYNIDREEGSTGLTETVLYGVTDDITASLEFGWQSDTKEDTAKTVVAGTQVSEATTEEVKTGLTEPVLGIKWAGKFSDIKADAALKYSANGGQAKDGVHKGDDGNQLRGADETQINVGVGKSFGIMSLRLGVRMVMEGDTEYSGEDVTKGENGTDTFIDLRYGMALSRAMTCSVTLTSTMKGSEVTKVSGTEMQKIEYNPGLVMQLGLAYALDPKMMLGFGLGFEMGSTDITFKQYDPTTMTFSEMKGEIDGTGLGYGFQFSYLI